MRKLFKTLHEELGQSLPSAEVPAVDYCSGLDKGPPVNAADVANDLFLRQVWPEYTVVLHFWPENNRPRWPTLSGQ